MIFRQLFDPVSSTYTYLVAQRSGGEAIIIDPVLDRVASYIELIALLDLQLVVAIDTHTHADHITGMGRLRQATKCAAAMGQESRAECLSTRYNDGEKIHVDSLSLTAIHTPGHTDDSYSFLMKDRILTGDTLLIRGTGRTDFQNGDPGAQYDSLFGKILTLPDNTLVFPAHDYNGQAYTTVGDEKELNPRLQVASQQEYIDLMNGLELEPPELMDVAVPANQRCGNVA